MIITEFVLLPLPIGGVRGLRPYPFPPRILFYEINDCSNYFFFHLFFFPGDFLKSENICLHRLVLTNQKF